jgi:hypothetical protein
MHYVVPGMKLIPQDKTMSCWYASGLMLVWWRRNQVCMSEVAHPDPSQVKKWSKLYDKNPGITNKQILDFASDMNLEAVPPMTPTPDAVLGWLQDYGPLWVNGKRHITVIAGIRDTSADLEVLVFDPAMPNKKHGEWRKLYEWYLMGAHSGRDTGASVETVFLHNRKI